MTESYVGFYKWVSRWSRSFRITMQSKNFSLFQKFPNYTQICTTEVLVIDKFIYQYMYEKLQKVITFVDSKSAIQKVVKTWNE